MFATYVQFLSSGHVYSLSLSLAGVVAVGVDGFVVISLFVLLRASAGAGDCCACVFVGSCYAIIPCLAIACVYACLLAFGLVEVRVLLACYSWRGTWHLACGAMLYDCDCFLFLFCTSGFGGFVFHHSCGAQGRCDAG